MPGDGLTHGPPATKKAGGGHHRFSPRPRSSSLTQPKSPQVCRADRDPPSWSPRWRIMPPAPIRPTRSLIRNCLSLNLPYDVQFLFPCREGEPWIARHPQCCSPPRSLCHGHQGDRPKCSLTVILRSDSPPAPPTDRRSRINAMNSISSPPEAAIIESRKR